LEAMSRSSGSRSLPLRHGGMLRRGSLGGGSRCWQALSALRALGVWCYLSRSPREGRGGQPILGRVRSSLGWSQSGRSRRSGSRLPLRSESWVHWQVRRCQMEHGISTTPSNAARTHTHTRTGTGAGTGTRRQVPFRIARSRPEACIRLLPATIVWCQGCRHRWSIGRESPGRWELSVVG
jgi:hypothetical protein